MLEYHTVEEEEEEEEQTVVASCYKKSPSAN